MPCMGRSLNDITLADEGMASMKWNVVLLIALLPCSLAAATRGSICVAPLPSHARTMDHDYPGGKAPREFRYQFSVQVGQGNRMPLPASSPVVITGLDTAKRHRVRIRDGEKVIESFSFTFAERGSSRLCLSYMPWYQTWSLERPGKRPWCKCQNSAP